jgi:hypothetical protein
MRHGTGKEQVNEQANQEEDASKDSGQSVLKPPPPAVTHTVAPGTVNLRGRNRSLTNAHECDTYYATEAAGSFVGVDVGSAGEFGRINTVRGDSGGRARSHMPPI